ncbi:hypothetical protein K431DRAFT_315419 [Polychaeton citri CBS 116435]|uniref:DUF3533 domain-containing protein n=1 Tax=Polychaeton citri CBS 116435 TaxID=1314669 RepID=A0A9P4Q4G3_9PEZI|nr:hypothetical protein K431DRAFT_315419 [Polychaeton citri CBS 116435]
MSYIYGAAYKSSERVHHLNVLAVDYDDGGIVSQSLHAACQGLESPEMLKLHWHSPNLTVGDLKQQVRSGRYWAGNYVFEGASQRLQAAIVDSVTAQTYNATSALGYIYNEARYTTIAGADVVANLQTIVAATRISYNHINGTQAISSIPHGNTASMAAVLDPIAATVHNIKPLKSGGKVFYNTVRQANFIYYSKMRTTYHDVSDTTVQVFTILLQFFFAMAFSKIIAVWQLPSRLRV